MNKSHLSFIIAISLSCAFISKDLYAAQPSASKNTLSNASIANIHPQLGISANPAAVNLVTGTAALQQYVEKQLGIKDNHGIRIGGSWIGDVNDLISGGVSHPEQYTTNSLFNLGLSIDTEKFAGLKGGLFDAEFLQFNGQNTNGQAGSIQGYNSLPGANPLNRSELYQLWYRQALLDDKMVLRIGKQIPTDDFDNVTRPVPLNKSYLSIPAVSGLIFTPLFVNPSMLGVIPGYYNSAYGITLNIAPIKTWYLAVGAYDGNLAQGHQTGMQNLPNFNGSYFYIAETGLSWLLGKNKMPGNVGLGAWDQDGLINGSPSLSENGAAGLYLFGTQRLWYRNPDTDISGISSFYQFGINNSNTLAMQKYIGAGLTGFGLFPNRLEDTMGLGAALAWLNQQSFNRTTELILQGYYQAQIISSIYVEPALSFIPTPGAGKNLSAAWAGTLRLIVLF